MTPQATRGIFGAKCGGHWDSQTEKHENFTVAVR